MQFASFTSLRFEVFFLSFAPTLLVLFYLFRTTRHSAVFFPRCTKKPLVYVEAVNFSFIFFYFFFFLKWQKLYNLIRKWDKLRADVWWLLWKLTYFRNIFQRLLGTEGNIHVCSRGCWRWGSVFLRCVNYYEIAGLFAALSSFVWVNFMMSRFVGKFH